MRCACAALFFTSLPILTSLPAVAVQSPDITGLEAYVEAIKQPRVADQIGAMEHFLQVSGQSTLRMDALEILVMDYQKMNNPEKAVARAHDLLNVDPSNPLAIAVLNADGTAAATRKARNDEFSAARRGLGNVDLLHKPEGMSQADFQQLQQRVRGMLAGAIGMNYLDQQDYEKATTYLQQAVAADPSSSRYNYGLAEALLSGTNGGTADAYWLMAKAVNMAKGTPNEQQIARDALRKYRENGGSEAVWNQLLAAAAASSPAPGATPGAGTAANGNAGQAMPSAQPPDAQASAAATKAPAAATPTNNSVSNTGDGTPAGVTAGNVQNTNAAQPPTASSSAVQPSQAAPAQTAPSIPAPAPSGTNVNTTNVNAGPTQPATSSPSPVRAAPSNTPAVAQPGTQPASQPASGAPTSNPPAQNQSVQTPPGPQASARAPTWRHFDGTPVVPKVNTQTPNQAAGPSPHAPTMTPQSPAPNMPAIARASPPTLPARATNLPESDQPILVSRPPITSTTPVGPTTSPLPDRKPAVAPPPVVSSPIITAPTGPVSLGILIQTEMLSGNYRDPILEAMREMARNLRPGDEAFVMAFSDELDFEQDLTENDELLEEGLTNLRPKPGAALFEGMAFAVQHLKRIGKNGNRVLLIISDGRNVPSRSGPQQVDADVSHVRIDCIGLDVAHATDRQNLQKLAYWSGGMTSFVSDPEQIRTATSAIARTIVGEGFANR